MTPAGHGRPSAPEAADGLDRTTPRSSEPRIAYQASRACSKFLVGMGEHLPATLVGGRGGHPWVSLVRFLHSPAIRLPIDWHGACLSSRGSELDASRWLAAPFDTDDRPALDLAPSNASL